MSGLIVSVGIAVGNGVIGVLVGVVVVGVVDDGNGIGPVICSSAGQEVLCLALYYQ